MVIHGACAHRLARPCPPLAGPLHAHLSMRRQRLKRGLYREPNVWLVAPVWVGLALVLGFWLPDLSGPFLGGVEARMSATSVTAFLASVASGMIAFTGLVFSLVFLLLQFGGSAYSPRLARAVGHSRIMGHAFGVFTGTFMYCLLGIRSVDLAGRPGVSTAVMVVAFMWLLASIMLFLLLMPGVRTLSIAHVLASLEHLGRAAIERTFPRVSDEPEPPPPSPDLPPTTHLLRHQGTSMILLDIDVKALVAVARETGGALVIPHAIGDPIAPGTPLVLLMGGAEPLPERRVRAALSLGIDRVIYRDPAYAIRLLVDIAARGLSPGVNDPTTATQVLGHLETLLLELGRRNLQTGCVFDAEGTLRLLYAQATWEDYLALSFVEIMQYGRGSVQVQRRLAAVLQELHDALPPSRRPAVERFLERRNQTLPDTFTPQGLFPEGAAADRQGLGHTAPPS